MPSRKPATPAAATPAAAARVTLPTAAERRSKQPPSLSHERIAADIAAFRRGGGKVEVLGNTPVLGKIGAAATAAAPAAGTRRRG